MKKYKGYYIDNVIFNSKKEIDEYIKSETIVRYKKLCEMFSKKPSMELMLFMDPVRKSLHDECFLSYEEIEAIENETC